MHILLVDISHSFINGYLYWWFLMIILLMAIGGYFNVAIYGYPINGY
jgi:hypothetical protein